MGVLARWDEEESRKIIIFDFDGDWTWHECREALQSAEFLAEDLANKPSYVYDLTKNRLPQRSYLSLMQKMFTGDFLTRNPEKIVVVEKGHFVETLKDMLTSVVADSDFTNVYFTDSLQRARAIIASEH